MTVLCEIWPEHSLINKKCVTEWQLISFGKMSFFIRLEMMSQYHKLENFLFVSLTICK